MEPTREAKRKRVEGGDDEGNVLLERWRANQKALPADFHRLLDPSLHEDRRGDLFEAEDERAMEDFAWAIPDERALRACAAFAPLVEMGAGAGYWASLLRKRGVSIRAFDRDVGPATRAAGVPAEPFTEVEKGGPEVLGQSEFSHAALMLIYPDDLDGGALDDYFEGVPVESVNPSNLLDEDDKAASADDDGTAAADLGAAVPTLTPLSVASLEAFQGDTVIHVGEWLGSTYTMSMEGQGTPDTPHPWGRSTSPEFQVLLSARFHKILQLPLPNWGSVCNCLTVWKRTATCITGDDRYAYVPPNERISLVQAAPCAGHLTAEEEKGMEPLRLASGEVMPRLGLGTFQAYSGDRSGAVGDAVYAAVTQGYRLLDCAAGYGNQAAIGGAMHRLFEEGVVKREELFVVSKLFQTHHCWNGDSARCHDSLAQTLRDLQLEYLDLLLIHWPFAFKETKLESPMGVPQPLRLADGSPNPCWTIKVEYRETWKAMETMVASGKVKSIGVSNFTIEQLEQLQASISVPISVNQVELNPYLQQKDLVEYCKKSDIHVMAYAPLGSSSFGRGPPAGLLLQHPIVAAVASDAGKTPAQVLIRWGLQRYNNLVSIPKSANNSRIAENADVVTWSLPPAAMSKLDSLNCGFRCFCSYMKTPTNAEMWHDGVIERGGDADYISRGLAIER